jgi:hypothetical protein
MLRLGLRLREVYVPVAGGAHLLCVKMMICHIAGERVSENKPYRADVSA